MKRSKVAIKEIQEHKTYSWQVQIPNANVLRKMQPQVGIALSKHPSANNPGRVAINDSLAYLAIVQPRYGDSVLINDGQIPNDSKSLGIAQPLENIVSYAYHQSLERTVFMTKVPPGKFDYIASLPSGNEEALQKEIKRKFGLIAKREIRNTDVLLLKIQNPNATGLKPSDRTRPDESSFDSRAGFVSITKQPLGSLAGFLESHFKTPVIDQTGLTNWYDIDLNWHENDYQHPNLENLKQALFDQLGLELVSTNMPLEMLVVEKAK